MIRTFIAVEISNEVRERRGVNRTPAGQRGKDFMDEAA